MSRLPSALLYVQSRGVRVGGRLRAGVIYESYLVA